jgi:hypothetical protein
MLYSMSYFFSKEEITPPIDNGLKFYTFIKI